ncbi:MAG: hypothetical protein K8F91_02140, partial [Candidatus Obscuribacterales bacterium]|nr:hypothetical protein [Candidatus Obscuribacterales bacterium]
MSTLLKEPGRKTSALDPNLAGVMSIVPGLGQLFNGESRKGLLFFSVGLINFSICLALLFSASMVASLSRFGQSFNIRPNVDLIATIENLRIGSPASLVLVGLFVCFIAYAMRDAYDHASRLNYKLIYADSVMEMPEATSGSYLFHIVAMITCLILAFFFLIPPPPQVQITDIQFIENQVESKPVRKSPVKADKSSKETGKRNPKKPVSTSSAPPKSVSSRLQPANPQQAKPQPSKPQPSKPQPSKPQPSKPQP